MWIVRLALRRPAPDFRLVAMTLVPKAKADAKNIDLGVPLLRRGDAIPVRVMALRKGTGGGPLIVIAAHLDTVFPEETKVAVTRRGSTLIGPGIGDNCRGLAVMLAIARAMNAAQIRTPGTVTFVADVGEEGLGDLRGMKALFQETLKEQIDQFVSIDNAGAGLGIIGVGSHRYRITFRGPGGHSFAQFGLPNPANALGRAITKIADLQVPPGVRTTFNVGRVGGGTSVNAIPADSWMEVDLRSSDPSALAALDARFRQAVEAGVVEENERWWRPGVVTASVELVGDRPGVERIASDDPGQVSCAYVLGLRSQYRACVMLTQLVGGADEPGRRPIVHPERPLLNVTFDGQRRTNCLSRDRADFRQSHTKPLQGCSGFDALVGQRHLGRPVQLALSCLESLLRAFEHNALYFDAHSADYYHPGRSARAVMDGATVARFGQLHPNGTQFYFYGQVFIDKFDIDAPTKIAGQALAAGWLAFKGVGFIWLPLGNATILDPMTSVLLTVLVVLV